jgi:hypothetical protein
MGCTSSKPNVADPKDVVVHMDPKDLKQQAFEEQVPVVPVTFAAPGDK